jgi:hypothetical protein
LETTPQPVSGGVVDSPGTEVARREIGQSVRRSGTSSQVLLVAHRAGFLVAPSSSLAGHLRVARQVRVMNVLRSSPFIAPASLLQADIFSCCVIFGASPDRHALMNVLRASSRFGALVAILHAVLPRVGRGLVARAQRRVLRAPANAKAVILVIFGFLLGIDSGFGTQSTQRSTRDATQRTT